MSSTRAALASIQAVSPVSIGVVWVEFDWGTDIFRARQIVAEKLQLVTGELPSATIWMAFPSTPSNSDRSHACTGCASMSCKAMPTRMAMSGTIDSQLYSSPIFTDIYDANRQLLGRIAETQGNPPLANMWSVVSPDGSRVHILQLELLQNVITNLVTYDISSASVGSPFPQIGFRPASAA